MPALNCFVPTDILLPKEHYLPRWSVVACDQYTSQPEYWNTTASLVSDAPSTLHITLPEIYLEDSPDERIKNINNNMRSYLSDGIFDEYNNAYIYVERTLPSGKTRHGLVGAVDLEAYEYSKGSCSPVRATESTIIERLPPRVAIRRDAPLELPHILLLTDDREGELIEPLQSEKDSFKKLYDFDLMQDGGHITGYLITGQVAQRVSTALLKLSDKKTYEEKYGCNGEVMSIAVGDGNHSLATAKKCYEELKKTISPEQALRHPARWVLAELVNIHDPSLEFEPIYRVFFDVDTQSLFDEMSTTFSSKGDMDRAIRCMYAEGERILYAPADGQPVVGVIQDFLDSYAARKGGRTDYIHGEDVVRELSMHPGTVGFVFSGIQKDELFKYVIDNGALPRKSFSMGEANEKRYYLECRKIK